MESNFVKKLVITLAVLRFGYGSPVAVTCSSEDPVDGRGVYIYGADRYFGCQYLQKYLDEDRHVGIFQNRFDYCQKPTTDCCASCAEIFSCQDVVITLAETQFDCQLLLLNDTKYEALGVYKNRKWLCSQDKVITDCCHTCKQVVSENESVIGYVSGTTFSEPTDAVKTTPPQQNTNLVLVTETKEPELEDECLTDCLHIADGSEGKCEWLLDPDRLEYNISVSLCRNGLADGCKRTCRDVIKGADDANSLRTTTLDKASVTATDSGCTDSLVFVDGVLYDCNELVNPISDLFNIRVSLCETSGHFCCVTCKQVLEESPSDVVKYNEENIAYENGGIVVTEFSTSGRKNSRQSTNKANNDPSSNEESKTTPEKPNYSKTASSSSITPATENVKQSDEDSDQLAMVQIMKKMISEHLQKALDNMFALFQHLQTKRSK